MPKIAQPALRPTQSPVMQLGIDRAIARAERHANKIHGKREKSRMPNWSGVPAERGDNTPTFRTHGAGPRELPISFVQFLADRARGY